MAWFKFGGVAMVAVLAGAMFVHAEEPAAKTDVPAAAEAQKPSDEKPKAIEKKKAVRLIKPWSELTSLSDEQKTQIAEIHKNIEAEIKLLRAREESEVTALLTEEQKGELAKLKEDMAAKGKKKEAGATTKPVM
jgi:Spy/CpxP family protein refolding chaperone